MKEKPKFSISKIFSNSWVITLSATLIGVFLALYLNEWVASRKLNTQKSIATQNIIAEINSNKKSLGPTMKKHIQMLEVLLFLGEHVNEEDEMIASKEAMNNFRNKHPNLIFISDSTLLKNGNYNYKGEINMDDISLPNLNLSNIAWNTLKNSGFSTSYKFKCLMYLEGIDRFSNEVKKKNEELLDYMIGAKDSGTKNEIMIAHLKLLIDFERSLLEIYENSEEEMKNCE